MTILLEYLNLLAQFLQAVFDAIFLHKFSFDIAKKMILSNYHSKRSPIIPELFLILFTTNYSKNYSGIVHACLQATRAAIIYLHQRLFVCVYHDVCVRNNGLSVTEWQQSSRVSHVMET